LLSPEPGVGEADDGAVEGSAEEEGEEGLGDGDISPSPPDGVRTGTGPSWDWPTGDRPDDDRAV
jgi:hypothetical protein